MAVLHLDLGVNPSEVRTVLRLTVSVLLAALFLSPYLSSVCADTPPSYLEPISSTDYKAGVGTAPAIALDDAGQMLVVYMAQPAAGGAWRLRSLQKTTGGGCRPTFPWGT